MGVFLIRREAGLVLFLGGDLQHVGVVPMAGPGIRPPFVLPEAAFAHGFPVRLDVARRAPAVRQRAHGRAVGDVHVVREAEHDVPPAVAQRLGHLLRLRQLDRIPVVLEIIDAPRRPLRGVIGGEVKLTDGPRHGLVVDAAFLGHGRRRPGAGGIFRAAADVIRIRCRPRRGIDPDLQTQCMHRVAQRLDVREFLVALNGVERTAARALPGIVDVHIAPAMVDQAGGRHGLRVLQHEVLADAAGVMIPAVPAHRRREGDGLAGDDLELPVRRAEGILRMQDHGESAGSLERTRDIPGLRIQREAIRQVVGGILHRPRARHRDVVEEGVFRADAEDAGAVDARGRGCGRGADFR